MSHRRTYFSKNSGNLIFFCDCNNNTIDQISNIDLTTIFTDSKYGPTFVVDPTDNSKYCIAGNNSKINPIIIGNYSLTGTISDKFMVAQSNQTDNSIYLVRPDASYIVEFDWYRASSWSSGGIVFDPSGSGYRSWSSTQITQAPGIFYYGECCFGDRNNTSLLIDASITMSHWNNVKYCISQKDSTSFGVRLVISNIDNSNVVFDDEITYPLPFVMGSLRRDFIPFLNDVRTYVGYNSTDKIKNVKVYEIV